MAGVDTDKLSDPRATVNGEDLKRLNALGCRLNQSGIPTSILVAEQLSFTNVGILGLAITASKNLREALELLRDYHVLSMPGLSITVQDEGALYCVDYEFDPDFGSMLPFLNEVFVCCMRRFTHLFEEEVYPEAIYWAHDPEFPLSQFEEFLNCPVLGRSQHELERSRVAFRQQDLTARLKYPDASTFSVIKQQLAAAKESISTEDSWEKRVEQIWHHYAEKRQFLTQKDMAELLNVSTRTLVRKLSDEGVQYREKTQKWRLALAKKLLKRTSVPVGDVAAQVGFEDETAFFRFFKDAEGVTPRKYRAM